MTNPFLVIPQMSSPRSIIISSNSSRPSSGMTQLDFSSSSKRGSSEMTQVTHNYRVGVRRVSIDYGNRINRHDNNGFFIIAPSFNFIK